MRNEDVKRNLRIGVFTLVALAVFGLALFTLGQKSGMFVTYVRLTAEFKNVQGLKEGQAVWLNGLDVGLVERLDLTSDAAGRIRVVLMIEKPYQPWVRADSIAVLDTKGLLGDKIVNISVGSPDQPMLVDGAAIRTADPADLANVINEASQILGLLKSSMTNVEAMISSIAAGKGTLGKLATDDSTQIKLNATLDELHRLLSNVNAGKGTVGQLVVSDALHRRVVALADRADGLIAKADAVAGSADQVLSRVAAGKGNLGLLLGDDALYANLLSATTSLKVFAGKLERGEGSVGKLAGADEFHDELVRLVQSLDALATDVRENPSRYFQVSVFGGRK